MTRLQVTSSGHFFLQRADEEIAKTVKTARTANQFLKAHKVRRESFLWPGTMDRVGYISEYSLNQVPGYPGTTAWKRVLRGRHLQSGLDPNSWLLKRGFCKKLKTLRNLRLFKGVQEHKFLKGNFRAGSYQAAAPHLRDPGIL